jgi:DNA-binding beta-propeller fold protein YncE
MQRRDFLGALAAAPLAAQTPSAKKGMLYVGAWQKKIIVIDEAAQKVAGEVELKYDVPRSLMLSEDKKKIIVHSMKDCGFEFVDIATKKVEHSFVLNEGGKRYRPNGFAITPDDKKLYTTFYMTEKKIDRFEVGKTKWGIIDIASGKLEKEIDVPKEMEGRGGRGGGLRFSPDGKFLYSFRDNVYIYDPATLKEVDKIELSKPMFPGMERVNVGPGDDPYEERGTVLGFFNSTDPIVHRSVFGFARFDLTKRTFDFTPVGPSTGGMMGMRLTPDRKFAYTVAFNGMGANRRTEFWTFDVAAKKLLKTQEFDGRSRFDYSISSDGKTLYIFGAGFELESFDAATLKQTKVLDVNADMTSNMLVVPG